MPIWALADLHLSFGVANKSMDVFGKQWINHPEKIRANWEKFVKHDDLVLIPGDISWGMNPEQAKKDLEWLDTLPGTKVLLKGNHDYWWNSLKKVEAILPPSLHLIQNNAFFWKNIAICGARLWDTPEFSFQPFIDYVENPRENILVRTENAKEAEKIFLRELGRLELSLKSMPKDAELRIVMTHYPPIGAELKPSRVSALLERFGINICVFGHLHNVRPNSLPFGERNKVRYLLTSCDYLNFNPIQLAV